MKNRDVRLMAKSLFARKPDCASYADSVHALDRFSDTITYIYSITLSWRKLQLIKFKVGTSVLDARNL